MMRPVSEMAIINLAFKLRQLGLEAGEGQGDPRSVGQSEAYFGALRLIQTELLGREVVR